MFRSCRTAPARETRTKISLQEINQKLHAVICIINDILQIAKWSTKYRTPEAYWYMRIDSAVLSDSCFSCKTLWTKSNMHGRSSRHEVVSWQHHGVWWALPIIFIFCLLTLLNCSNLKACLCYSTGASVSLKVTEKLTNHLLYFNGVSSCCAISYSGVFLLLLWRRGRKM